MTDLTDAEREVLEALPQPSIAALAEVIGRVKSTTHERIDRANDHEGVEIEKVDGEWRNVADRDDGPDVDLEAVKQGEDPDPEDLTPREEYVVSELQTGATVDGLAEDLDARPSVVSPSPKPSGEFVERLGETVPSDHDALATAHGVSDDGITTLFPIDTRHYSR